MVSIKAKDCLKKETQQWTYKHMQVAKTAPKQFIWLINKITGKQHYIIV
jgi:hypothetical protein